MKYIMVVRGNNYDEMVAVRDFAKSLGMDPFIAEDDANDEQEEQSLVQQVTPTGGRFVVLGGRTVEIVTTTVTERPSVPNYRDRPNYVYGMWRGTELGYVGTSVNPEQRIEQHLAKVKAAKEPIIKWLIEGDERGDIERSIEGPMPYTEARRLEQLLIRKYDPLFNKQHSGGIITKLNANNLRALVERLEDQ